ncbi:SRPBCC family protein [Pseudonocardia xishanensis]|uniref:Aromatic-ring-hydroxylating dioxygenase alpha subunit C-terminal domain-containing protein n=1 Tax=Pseudonocardia xishanensis TaxID=630995 RepID=A0ABP8RTZ6_9PSEU
MTSTPRRDRIQRALDHLREGTTEEFASVVPFGPEQYRDPEIARRERDLVFGRVPSIVAHGSEIAAAGDVLTVRMPRNLVRVERQDDGSAQVFVEVGGRRGPALPTQERHGLVWMVDAVGVPIDVADWLGPEVDAILAGYGLEDLRAIRSEGFDEPANWKLMQDAFTDNYHIQYAHPNTAGKHVHTNVQVVEDFGRHARMLSPRKKIDRWLEEDAGDRDLGRYVIDGHFLLPNSTLLRQPDDHFELLTFRPHPSDPAWCRMEMRLLVPSVEASGLTQEKWQATWDKNWEILLAVLHQEDFPLLRSAQIGLASASAGGMLLGRNEVVNQIFHRELQGLLDV